MMSMSNGMRMASACSCVAILLAGCSDQAERLNAPPQGASERPHEMQDTYTYMHDNAMLAEMSMSAVHFVPNRPEVTALGLRRLMRYVDLLKEYGGTLHYDGIEDPEPLAQERVQRIRAFLVEAGVDPHSFKVEPGVAGGQGMRTAEAMAARQYSTFSPEQQEREEKNKNWEDERSFELGR